MNPPAWNPPDDWQTIETIDSHAAGEPLRVVIDGWPDIEGETILEKRRYATEHHDHLRKALMWEPRGHADMYGAIPVEPERDNSDLGVLFTHNDGYSTMCGHGVIALATVAFETEMFDAADDHPSLRMDTPAGQVTAQATVEAQSTSDAPRVTSVAFENVPSFVYALDQTVDVRGIGEVTYDIAFGGAFYAYCDAASVGVGLEPADAADLVRVGRNIKHAVSDDLDIEHPVHEDLSFLYGTIFTGKPPDKSANSRNVCVFADGEVDRSPTGTGVSGRLALELARGSLADDEPFTVESIVGTTFTGRVKDRTTVGPHDAVVPEITGRAYVTGRNEFVVDPADPLGEGFLLR